MDRIQVIIATSEHLAYCREISDAIASAAQDKNSGLAQRAPDYIAEKILAGNGIIALDYGPDAGEAGSPILTGFCYIQPWEHDLFVSHSGLIILPQYRGKGLATAIKKKALELSADKFPQAKVFGLTTSPAVRKINLALGYSEVPYSDITADINFWKGCSTCVHYATLCKESFEHCECTAMVKV